MDEFYRVISKLSLGSFCSDITQLDETSIEFKLRHSFHQNRKEEIFSLIKTEKGLMLSDNGSTFANLDDIFVLDDFDVMYTISKIKSQFKMRNDELKLVCDIDISKELVPQIFYYLQGIHFLYAMKLFFI
jgi:hypothetical protein